jgi:hypothetical protein
MLNDILLVLLGAMISPIFSRLFSVLRTRYQLELNSEFYNLKVIKYVLKIVDKIEPYLLKACGVISFIVGITIFIYGFIFGKVLSACLLLPFFIIAGCLFYSQVLLLRLY